MDRTSPNDNILTDLKDGILSITINRPEKKNALTMAMYMGLSKAIIRGEEDKQARVFLIHGTGGSFTSGNDLKDFLDVPPRDENSPVFQFMRTINAAKKPIVAAVNGSAVGIGTTMLLHCDLVYAAKDAKFNLPFVNLGLCPEAGSSFLLPLLAGYHRAAELLLLGEPFSAEKAKEIGLVNEISEDETTVIARATEKAKRLASQPQVAVLLTKEMLKKRLSEIVRSTMSEEIRTIIERFVSPEAKEALSAFFERRSPNFEKFNEMK